MITIPLAKLQSAAKVKAQGYYDACIAAGTVVDNNLQLTDEAFAALRAKFATPSLATQAQSATAAVAAECDAVLSGETAIDDATRAARIAACEQCAFFIVNDRRCQKCGCWMEIKTRFRSAICLEGKW
jgi:hypothetical protein